PNTIVVLNTSDPVAMPWLPNVKAVLEMWYPGDTGGYATANVLLGRTDPAGRLPFTWPATLDQGVANQPATHPERTSNGIGTNGNYCPAPGGGLTAGFRVANTGTATGDDVPQLYLGTPASPPAGVPFASKALAAYTRLTLRPGQSQQIWLHVPLRPLQYWNTTTSTWQTATGQRPIYLATSERTTALTITATISGK
ncbi:MAG: glycoside hydrolase family 3 C-terminal domain-containing protein, partial [Gemmatimonadota bacterium]